MYYARTEKSLILSARCVCNNLVASLSKQVVTLFGYFTHLLLASCRQTCSNLFRASDIRLVGTTCNKSNEVVNITYHVANNLFHICGTTGNKQWESFLISTWWTDLLQLACRSVTTFAFSRVHVPEIKRALRIHIAMILHQSNDRESTRCVTSYNIFLCFLYVHIYVFK